ncbi:MAG: primase-helicase family protein [Pseudomonadota bacterium]
MDKVDVLKAINDRYFAARIGGRLRFFEDRFPLEGMDAQAMRYTLATHKVQVETKDGFKTEPAYKHWEEWHGRRFYPDGFILDPNAASHGERAYNLWRGYGVEPIEGDIDRLLQHLEVIETDAREYIWKWICWVIQNPAAKPKVAVVLRGAEGVGKGFIGQCLMRIFGEHAMQLTQRRHVTGNFNAHLRHICLLFADEADFTATDGEGVLKTLITEETMAVEAKGVDVKQEASHIAMFMSTNRDWAVPAGLGARRFVVADVGDDHKGNSKYWEALFGWLDDGGASALLKAALAEDLTGWHPEKNRVATGALRDQQANSLRGIDRLLFRLLWEGEACDIIPSRWLIEQAERLGEDKDVSMTLWHRLIGKGKVPKTTWQKEDRARPVGWRPPQSLRQAREELFPGTDWPDDREEWTMVSAEELKVRDCPF